MITPIAEILAQTEPREVQIDGWEPGTEITVRIKRPNFYALLAADAVPNPLIPVVQRLFAHSVQAEEFAKADPDFARALQVIARETLVEPSYAELAENGISLTDSQLLELSMYATGGARALSTFRGILRGDAGGHGPGVSDAAEPAAEDRRSADGVVSGSGDLRGAGAAGCGRKAAAEEARE